MKRILFSLGALCALSFCFTNSQAQSANTSLSNLTAPTAIPVSLLPSATTRYSLGSGQYPWKDIFFNGVIYDNGERFIFGSTKTFNSYFGMKSGAVNTTGTHNTGVGYEALFFNSTGTGNSAVGYRSLSGNGGSYNTAIGYEVLYRNQGNYNVAVGHQALYTNQGGSNNTVIGTSAMFHNGGGSNNIAVGLQSLVNNSNGTHNIAIGINALFDNYGTSYNTAVGDQAGSSDAEYGTFLGANASASYGLSNVTAVGNGAYATESNQVVLGNTAVTSIGGQVNWTAFSDGRFKTNIKSDVPGLSFINQLNPVTYNLDVNGIESAKKSTVNSRSGENSGFQRMARAETAKSSNEQSRIVYTGFVAQEVEKVAKSLNYNFSGVDAPKTKDGFYGLRYGDFVVPLVKAVQELSKENDSLKMEVAALKIKDQDIEDLKKQLNELKQLVLSKAGTTNGTATIDISGASLEQNAPNPYNGTTIIRYHVPLSSGEAKLVITDIKGSVIKSINLNNKGNGQIQLSDGSLAAGTYNYSLWVNNKQADSRHMVIMK